MVAYRWTVVPLNGSPQLRHLLDAEVLRNDPDLFDLIGQSRCRKRSERIGKSTTGYRGRECKRLANRSSIEHGPLVQELHRIAKQYLRMQIGISICCQQIMQIERQRRIAHPRTVTVARRQIDIAPPLVRGDLIEEKIETRLRAVAVR